MSSTKNILAIYAGQDKDVLRYLLPHFQPLTKEFNITIWSEDAIDSGQPWNSQNGSRLHRADVFLIFLSNTFMNSEFIEHDEFKGIIDRYKEGSAIVIPILLDECPWDIEFTSDDFNFKELQVFRKDKDSVGDWSPADKVCMQVAYYVRGLLSSSTKKNVLEVSENREGKKLMKAKKDEQIVIDFFPEREVDPKVDSEREDKIEAEAKKRDEESKRLEEEAEAKELIRREKRLRQKAEIQKRIEKEVQAKRMVQEESWGNTVASTQIAVEENRRAETTNPLRETEQETSLSEIVTARRKVANNNSLARYNYQFVTEERIDAKRVVQEERRGDEEVKVLKALEEKRLAVIAKSQRETEREKRQREFVAPQQMVKKAGGLARYNYQFKGVEAIEPKNGEQKERRGTEETKAKVIREEKRLDELVLELKKTLKRSSLVLRNYQVKSTEATKQFLNAVKSKLAGEKKGLAVVEALKKVIQRTRAEAQNYQVKITSMIVPLFKEAKKNIRNRISTHKIRGVRSEFLIVGLVIFGILIYVFTGESEKQSIPPSEIEEVQVNSNSDSDTDAGTDDQIKTNSLRAAAILKLGVGDVYNDGIIFAIDPSNKTGKIAAMVDVGPMTWNNAMTIHEQLGEGWRLPTLEELRLMYNTIGQGSDNRGKFSNELYWSATPFDDYQARLLRFSDGNGSYHFNSSGTHRKFLVRAIRDFER
ncbi:TIR domain-containing protein [Pseudozobellia sp. WGM2]|uniref:TIR domain-containing protein n=1 Tax=Pseudozobellia sp. WGM2 TaxID=2787625 RepID=UPI001ADFC588|nr:TIR domain-containing protein [Pseudozobellia sp. WGM2]